MTDLFGNSEGLPPIGSLVRYTVKGGGRRVGRTNEDVSRTMTVAGHEPGVVVIEDERATIRAEWPEWWQDGTCEEVVDGR